MVAANATGDVSEFTPMGRRRRKNAAASVKACRLIIRTALKDNPPIASDDSQEQRQIDLDRRRAVAGRLAAMYWPDGVPSIICLRFEFWQALLCGWDLLSPKIREGHAPEQSPTFIFWDNMADIRDEKGRIGNLRDTFADERRVTLARPRTMDLVETGCA